MGRSIPPTAGDPRAAPFYELQEFRGAEMDKTPTLRPSRMSPFADLGAFASRQRLGKTPTRGPRAYLFTSLGRLASSPREISLCSHPPPSSAGPEASRQASSEYNFSFLGSGRGDGRR